MELHAQIACEMPTELMKKGLGWADRAVYCEAILFCRAKLTDGVIHRALLGLWMPDMSVKERARRLDSMIGRALLEHPDGWEFPPHVWGRWNPSRAEVDAKRAEEAARKAEYRAKKKEEKSARSPNGVPVGQVVAATRLSQPCPRQPEPEPEPEPITPLIGETKHHPTRAATSHGTLRRIQ